MVDHIFAEQGEDVAAVVIEPMPANNGLPRAARKALQHLHPLRRAGPCLIFDEVITGFGLPGWHHGARWGDAGLGRPWEGHRRWPTGGRLRWADTSCNSWRRWAVYRRGKLSVTPGHGCGVATLDLLNDDAHAHLEALGALLEETVTPCLPVTDTHAAGAPSQFVLVLTWP
ncbi:MAG: hypothetical protein CM15mP128_5190 [Methanobacteriota archaeon]|nr:MAG: hypothetical protein CM15mP128_5190 [Euryarchaeota archaeon]